LSAGPSSISVRLLASERFVDHYAVLGVKPDATSKEIKAAFYELSKKYHPDLNKENEADAKKFHEVSLAYEILGSDEKRKVYDMTRIRTTPSVRSPSMGSSSTYTRPKQYTDLDIDYKDFEHFQRHTRRRKQYHSHFDMPDEFYAEFGGQKGEFKRRIFKSEFEESKELQQKKYPIPTFEQMMREKREKERDESRKQLVGAVGFATVAAAVLFIARHFFR
uniref:DnaJ homolog subfamily A member 3, mitochondrial (inferred by orthology to a human protein) n=1 Tax=Nippostrongylus brasiliensis TaxID=27835 RepID=A0A0N4Y6Z6_NIPBR